MKRNVARDALHSFARGPARLLVSLSMLGCAQLHTRFDLLACANGDYAQCRAAAARAAPSDADALREWACRRGDDEACLERLRASRACAPQGGRDCPLVGERVGEAGAIATRGCAAGSAAGCALATALGHRTALVRGTTLAEGDGGSLLGFLDGEYLLTESGHLELWQLTTSRQGLRELQRSEARPIFEESPGSDASVMGRVIAFGFEAGGSAAALLELGSRQYVWSLGKDGVAPPHRLPEPARSAVFTPEGNALLVAMQGSGSSQYGLGSTLLRLYDPRRLQPGEPGVEVAAEVGASAASNQHYAVLEYGGVHLFERSLGQHVKLPQRGVPHSLAFSGDGRWLAVTTDQTLVLYAVSGSPRLMRTRYGRFGVLAFSPNGEHLAVETERGVLLLDPRTLAAQSSELQTRSPWERLAVGNTRLLFDPSGSALLVERAGRFLVVSLTTTPQATLVEPPAALADPRTWFHEIAPIPLGALFDQEIATTGPWQLAGTVLLDEQPVAGASVTLVPDLDPLGFPGFPLAEWRRQAAQLVSKAPGPATTDASGRFRFADLPPIPWRLDVGKSGLVTRGLGSGGYLPGYAGPAQIRMVRCATLRGKVSRSNGGPAAAFKVFVSGDQTNQNWLAETRTDPEGHYHFDCLRPSSAHLDAIGPEGEAAYRHIVLDRSAAFTADLEALSFDSPRLHRLLVFGDDGKPVADVEVKGYPGNDRTGASGRWASACPELLPPTVSYRGKLLKAAGAGRGALWRLRLPTAEVLVVHPKLAKGDGMTLGRTTPEGVEYAEGVEEAEGTRFSGLTGGHWTLWHVDDRGRLGSLSIEVSPRQQVRVQPPVGSVQGIPFEGVLVDAGSGKPLLGVTVRASCFNAPNDGRGGRPLRTLILETDPAGRFRIPCLARDRHTFFAQKAGYLDVSFPVDARFAAESLTIPPVRLRRAHPELLRRLLHGL